jgi:hypothetical protein
MSYEMNTKLYDTTGFYDVGNIVKNKADFIRNGYRDIENYLNKTNISADIYTLQEVQEEGDTNVNYNNY